MSRSQYSILVVDDEEGIHDLLDIGLSESGYSVSHAANGELGFQMFLDGSFDAVITDRAMPQMTGEQLAREIKNISPNTPIILITGLVEEDSRVQFFDEVLPKPFEMCQLSKVVGTVLAALS